MNVFQPQWSALAPVLRPTWAGLGNIDQFRWLARADVLRQLEMARDELGLRHVRAAAMYSPEMRVWTHALSDWRRPAEERARCANWQLVDMTFEALLERGLKPIYTTCFTPPGFSDDPAVCWPDRNPIGMPRDLDEWAAFVADGLRHHVRRFGREELRSWYFECWNEPNLRGGFFGGTKEDFFRLWSATWRAVKSVDSEFRFGGPSTARAEWIPEFLDWTAADGTPPDYLIAHIYNNDSEAEPLSPFDGPASHKVKDSPHFATGVIRGLRRELDARHWRGEVHWNEWGRSWFPHDPDKESPLEAAFVVKTMAETSQTADGFAFWCLSDIYDQIGFQASEFQGHYGLLSLHGLRKPAWFAHQLLNRLGPGHVPVSGGDALSGALAARKNDGGGVLIWLYPQQPASIGPVEAVRVELPPGHGTPRLWRIGSKENNILDTWREMGAPASPSREELRALHEANHLTTAPFRAARIESGTAVFDVERPGVALLEFS
jgi:xylan 1,4-beta-xylosidase